MKNKSIFTAIFKNLLFLALFSLVFIGYSQSSDIARVERKTNTIDNNVQALTDSVVDLTTRIDEQYLEIQRLQESVNEDLDKIKSTVGVVEDTNVKTKSGLDRFWILISAALVFFMQAGFKVLEMGMVRRIHGTGIGMKNLIDFIVVAIIYFLVGFSFMFGESFNGFIGSGFFAPSGFQLEEMFNDGKVLFGMEFFMFQLAFAATSVTIVSGAMSERTALIPYLLIALFVGGFIYPIVGHMVWGNIFIEGGKAWLGDLGFLDFAGSTVVHGTGAWVAIIGVWIIGPRIGRFRINGSVNTEKFKPYSLGYSFLGVFILWFGWWGFNGGSTLTFDASVSVIIVNTSLAAAFAALSALVHAIIADQDQATEKLIGGVLAGLVAITAGANVVDSWGAIMIGLVAGVIHNISYDLLLKFKLDDPVSAIPVHGIAGFWGTIAVGIFGKEAAIREALGMGVEDNWVRLDQIVTQLFGSGVVLVFSCVAAFIFFKIIDALIGLRVDPEKENSGYILVSKKNTTK